MAIYDGATEEKLEGEQVIMDIKINVGEYVKITTNDDKAYTGLVTAKEQSMQMVGYMNFINSLQFMKTKLLCLIIR